MIAFDSSDARQGCNRNSNLKKISLMNIMNLELASLENVLYDSSYYCTLKLVCLFVYDQTMLLLILFM